MPADLAHFDELYRALGSYGWAQPVVDQMELWVAASYMGVPGRDPVICGTRQLSLRGADETESTVTRADGTAA